MRRKMKKRQQAFTLVEVTLAIGIMAFSLMALLGLFNVGFQASRRSAEATALPTLIDLIKREETSGNGTAVGSTRTVFFTYEGEKTTASDSHYQCIIVAKSPDDTVLPHVSGNMVLLMVTITSPGNEKKVQISCIR